MVYEVDAGPGRTAILQTLSDVPTLRCMAGLAERGGWLLRDVGDDRLASSVESLLRAQMPSPPIEVEEQWADPSRWKVVFVHRLQQAEHNTVTETRAAVQAIRHHVRQFSGWHTHLMILSDAGAAIGCLSKGRTTLTNEGIRCTSLWLDLMCLEQHLVGTESHRLWPLNTRALAASVGHRALPAVDEDDVLDWKKVKQSQIDMEDEELDDMNEQIEKIAEVHHAFSSRRRAVFTCSQRP